MLHDEILHKWFNDELNQAELEAFSLRPEYESLMQLKKQLDVMEAPDFDQEAMLSEILASGKETKIPIKNRAEKGTEKRGSTIPLWTKLAACASVLFLLGYMFWPSPPTQQNWRAETSTLEGVLPDQSEFSLSAGSSLNIDPDQWAKERKVRLDGDSYFKVEPGSTFSVVSELGMVSVLGTEFDVDNESDFIEVTCDEGKVGFESSGEPKLKTQLLAGERLRYYRGGKSAVYKTRNVQLKNHMVKDVVAELEKIFKVNFKMPSVDLEQIINCNFQKKDMAKAIETSLGLLDLKYKQEGNTVVFY